MRTIHTDEIIKNIKEMCIEANLSLTEDMKCRFKNATESEKSPLGKQILNQLQENMEIAAVDQIPICQDTGMAEHYEVGDIVKLKKPHPCGSSEWEILRVGADFRLKCTGCGHQIMVARKLVEKNTRGLRKKDA